MNHKKAEKIFSKRKIDNDDNKNHYIYNKKLKKAKEYNQKEKEYIKKYKNISKDFLNEEKLYDIISKFNFNDQLILSEIFYLMNTNEPSDSEEHVITCTDNNCRYKG